ncbi:MAG: LytR/AlgR family response regulator transcription factor [Cellulosilyticaceae bacterium]
MSMKVLLVEDEAGIRLLMRKIIEKHESFEIIGECDNMTDAIKLFSKHKPEVVFMDVELSGGSGIECAKIIADIDAKAKIIFATAHAEYMPTAFEVYAFDYLVKPFNVERVGHTLERIKNLFEASSEGQEMDKIVRYEKGLDKLLVKGKESMSFVDIKDIILIQREDKSTVIYTAKDSFTTSATLTEIEEKLDKDQFMRSHKSYIINLSQITKITPYGRWTYIVRFKDLEQDALITQEKYEEIKRIFL